MKTVKFKDFIDYNKRLGKIIIIGIEGSGKTMLLSRIAIGKMLHGMQDCWKSYEVVDEYNALGFNFSKNYEHLAFSNIDINCLGTYIPDRVVYKCNPYRLGLYDPFFETDIYPPYSAMFLTEGYNFLNSYLYNKFRDSFKAYLKTCRQHKIDMVVDTHSIADICTIFKRLTNRFIYLYKPVEEIKDIHSIVVGHRMFVREWTNYRDVEAYEKSPNSCKNYDEYELIIDKCMYENYDTEFCKYLSLEGRQFQDYVIQVFDKIEKAEDLENFGEKFGIIAPEGFFIGDKRKKEASDLADSDEEGPEDDWNYDF